jgi:hypothetical protein
VHYPTTIPVMTAVRFVVVMGTKPIMMMMMMMMAFDSFRMIQWAVDVSFFGVIRLNIDFIQASFLAPGVSVVNWLGLNLVVALRIM